MGLARFMATGMGRGIRVVAGLALICYGLLVMKGTNGYILAAVGLLPIAMGSLNLCLLAPILGAPFSGKDLDKGA
jgi:hypothetical protein